MSTEPYYAKDGVVWKAPVETVNEDGTKSISIGFPVCIMHDCVSADGAEAVAELLNLGARAKAMQNRPPPVVSGLQDKEPDGYNLTSYDTPFDAPPDPLEGMPGVGIFGRAIQVWTFCNEDLNPTVEDVAAAFHVDVALVEQAVRAHPWMEIEPDRTIYHEGE